MARKVMNWKILNSGHEAIRVNKTNLDLIGSLLFASQDSRLGQDSRGPFFTYKDPIYGDRRKVRVDDWVIRSSWLFVNPQVWAVSPYRFRSSYAQNIIAELAINFPEQESVS